MKEEILQHPIKSRWRLRQLVSIQLQTDRILLLTSRRGRENLLLRFCALRITVSEIQLWSNSSLSANRDFRNCRPRRYNRILDWIKNILQYRVILRDFFQIEYIITFSKKKVIYLQ